MLQSSERTIGFHGSESLRQLQIVEIHRGALMRGRCGADDPRRRRGHVAQSPGRDEIGHVVERKRGLEPILGLLLSLGLFSAASWASVTGDLGPCVANMFALTDCLAFEVFEPRQFFAAGDN